MDGRVQVPLLKYLRDRYETLYVDSITEPGPVRILAAEGEGQAAEQIRSKISLSLTHHRSRMVAVSAHHDCAGNPEEESLQKEQVRASVVRIRKWFPGAEVIGLWVDADFEVEELEG
jgi:hypothetical protein